MRRHWKAAAAVVAIVAALAAAVLALGARHDQAAPRTAVTVAGGGRLGFPVSPVKIGAGGSGAAADGRTPIGYDGSCSSAAAAAANFMPVIADVHPSAWPTQQKALAQIDVNADEFEAKTTLVDLEAKNLNASGIRTFGGDWVTRTDVESGGLYRLVSCTERRSALVQVVYARIDAQTGSGPKSSFVTQSLDLAWQGGDWKVTRSQTPLGDNGTLGGRLPDRGPNLAALPAPEGKPPLLTKDLADQAFADVSRQGWIEYANALR